MPTLTQLAGLRKKERLRELFSRRPTAADDTEPDVLAAALAPVVGMEPETAIAYLTEFAEAAVTGRLAVTTGASTTR